jgi:hypothetical protein
MSYHDDVKERLRQALAVGLRPKGAGVDLRPLRQPIEKCCSKVTGYEAIPTVVASSGKEPTRVGYTLHPQGCSCRARFLDYDWRYYEHAEFVTIEKPRK